MNQIFIPVLALLTLSAELTEAAPPLNGNNFMSCMFCDTVTDAFETEVTPTGVIQAMFRTCNRMGLMEPICDNFITVHGKQILLLARSGVPPSEICGQLLNCERN
ncbi:unnamed protein product [Auanema sp. JU1783]|nr:unnamed protein product [Auanema sp. JU1783]